MSKKVEFYKNGTALFLYTSQKFYNKKSIILNNNDFNALNLSEFPTMEDFDILYLNRKGDMKKGKSIHFFYYSQANGLLNGFPYWHRNESNIKNMAICDIPVGTLESPFFDVEQGGWIYIFEKGDYVYFMYSHNDDCSTFKTWYRVKKDIYLYKWRDTIRFLRDSQCSNA